MNLIVFSLATRAVRSEFNLIWLAIPTVEELIAVAILEGLYQQLLLLLFQFYCLQEEPVLTKIVASILNQLDSYIDSDFSCT